MPSEYLIRKCYQNDSFSLTSLNQIGNLVFYYLNITFDYTYLSTIVKSVSKLRIEV